MVPFTASVSVTSEACTLTLDTQGRENVGTYIKSSGDAVHKIQVSMDATTFYDFKTITFDGGASAEQEDVDVNTLPWRYVRLATETEDKDHTYHITAK